MKTETYTTKMNTKAKMVAEMKALNEQLAVAREYKRTNPEDEAAKIAYRTVKDAHAAMHNQLIEFNKELKEMRKNGEDKVASSGKRKSYTKKSVANVNFTDLNSLKEVLNTQHIPYKNRGIMLEVKDKKVVYSHGHFYVNKVMVEPAQLLKSL